MILQTQNLVCGFNKSSPVLEGIDFSVAKAEIIFILGPNGIGKSCLVQTLSGVISPIAGEAPHLELSAMERAKLASYCAQEVIESSDLLVENYLSLITPTHKSLFDLVVKELEIKPFLSKSLIKLSGGERQRVRLGACLLQDSKVYLLDEPTNSLDPKPIQNLSRLLLELKELSKSSVIVSHDLGFAINTGTRFIGIDQKRILFDCDQSTLREKKLLDQLYSVNFNWAQVSDSRWALC
ncbi:MAG: hypothetical protein CME71_03350 [Halobacteriovorax sp.]|nr:hypothetical protein [Halobacteriovorax sp.]